MTEREVNDFCWAHLGYGADTLKERFFNSEDKVVHYYQHAQELCRVTGTTICYLMVRSDFSSDGWKVNDIFDERYE
jgi:hypothetical protein